MTNTIDSLTSSLISYIEDIKPYHTKLRDVSSRLFFNDSIKTKIVESYNDILIFQNKWSIDDIGGFFLSNLSGGSTIEPYTFSGIGNGKITALVTNTPIAEQWTIVALNTTSFVVTGSISGSYGTATVNIQYSNPKISFMIISGIIGFAAGDTFTFNIQGHQSYLIPDAIFPRFSLNDRLNFGQTPNGTDPATLNIQNQINGIPVNEQPWITSSGSFINGNVYQIVSLGTTDFTLIGALSNTIGLIFRAGSPWIIGPDPTTGNGTALLDTQSTVFGWYDMLPVSADIISAEQNGTNFDILINIENEIDFGFKASSIQIVINGILYPIFTNSIISEFVSLLSINTIILSLSNKVEVLYLTTGRYSVPYNQGCRVRIDSIEQSFNKNFIVDNTRSFIQFLPSHIDNETGLTIPDSWPTLISIIDINLFRSDKLFICWQDPFEYKINPDSFLITVGNSPSLIYAGSGEFIIGESYTIVFSGTTNWSLIGCAQGQNSGSFIMTPGDIISVQSLIPGKSYTILELGNTNFIPLGASINIIGEKFIATFIGSGTGTVTANFDTSIGTGIAAPIALMNISIPINEIEIGYEYKVILPDQNLNFIGSSNIINSSFIATSSGIETAGSFVIGALYRINSIGNTDFTLIGAPINDIGIPFTATSIGIGTGIASLIGYGLVAPINLCDVSFVNTKPGTHKAILTGVKVRGARLGDIWKLTAIGPWSFKVDHINTINSTSYIAKFKTLYDDNILSFIIDRTWMNYYVNSKNGYDSYYIIQDINNYISYDELQFQSRNEYDPSEFFPDLSIKTEKGDVSNIYSSNPVRFEQFGVVKKNSNKTYVFEFDSIPPPYTYIEFRVEQEGQYNPWVHTSVNEDVIIAVTYQDTNTTKFLYLK